MTDLDRGVTFQPLTPPGFVPPTADQRPTTLTGAPVALHGRYDVLAVGSLRFNILRG